MKTVIARKKYSAGILYMVLTALGIFMITAAIVRQFIPIGIVGAISAVLGAVMSVRFLMLPSDIIVLSDDTLILPGGVTVSLNSVSDVSYRRASGRGLQYRWGAVILSTYHGSYKYGFVADCEDVSKQLNGMVYDAKQKNNSER